MMVMVMMMMMMMMIMMLIMMMVMMMMMMRCFFLGGGGRKGRENQEMNITSLSTISSSYDVYDSTVVDAGPGRFLNSLVLDLLI